MVAHVSISGSVHALTVESRGASPYVWVSVPYSLEAHACPMYRGLVATWPMPLVRDGRHTTWQSDEEVRTRAGYNGNKSACP